MLEAFQSYPVAQLFSKVNGCLLWLHCGSIFLLRREEVLSVVRVGGKNAKIADFFPATAMSVRRWRQKQQQTTTSKLLKG